MSTPYTTSIGSWVGRSTFFWAATGATVGLGNLWQFPYLASQHGGGLFIVLYLACLLLITLPLALTEAALGRRARHGIVLTLDRYVRLGGLTRNWVWVGRLSLVAGFLVLSFTLVIGALCLAYVFYGALGRLSGVTPGEASAVLAGLVSEAGDHRQLMGWHGVFLFLVVAVSLQGVSQGLERSLRIVVPMFLLLLLGMLGYAGLHGNLPLAIDAVLVFDRAGLSWVSLQYALFHAFYTLGLGVGVWVLFGAYTPDRVQLKLSVFAVALMDTLVAVVAGVMVYALVLSHTPDVGLQGFGLLFLALPLSLTEVAASQVVIALLFLMVVLIAWSTAIALLEPLVGWLQEWLGVPRKGAVLLIALLVWFVGLGTVFSFNVWSEVRFAGGTVYRWLELLASGVLVPLVSVLLAVMTVWRLQRPVTARLAGALPMLVGRVWFWVMRLVLPLVVAYIGIHYSVVSIKSVCAGDDGWQLCATNPRALAQVAAGDADTGGHELPAAVPD
ncbi:sodium-dependent transporter [Marinobacter sp. X15-166B]|uniref:sodium-dependent transporter n=1 Tax=Marinobacter sp. X15-166B TaxID=1897620 RepID=UPI00085CD846|nr:sodium-dependent transporter [Marinobacter sp. X15-166B]OEY65629.1 sodium:calcium symporter [Marinobacter sp. X15-166B]